MTLESLARTIAKARHGTDAYWANYMEAAEAVVAALYEPTEYMLSIGACYEDPDDKYAAEVALGIRSEGDIADDVWRNMFQARFREGTLLAQPGGAQEGGG